MPFDNNAGKKPGLEIWRIEKMEPVRVEAKDFGSFHSGDCYIVMKTTEKSGAYDQALHYWIGEKSTQDEQGAVAYQAVALDDSCGGRPVQYREVQGHESHMFLSYFKSGVKYLDGGVDSAFRHVDPSAYKPRLFHLKGKRNVRVGQVELKASSLNDGDVFILDLGLTLYQWNGAKANKFEKFKGLEMINKIKDEERGGKATAVFLESGKNDDDEAFWKVLGDKKDVKHEDHGGDDDVKAHPAELFHVSHKEGKVSFESIAKGKLEKKMLDSNDAFILDTGAELFVWIGKGADKEERNKGMAYAVQHLAAAKRPAWTPITRLAENGETPVFKSFFSSWPMPQTEMKAEAKKQAEADIGALYSSQKQAEEAMVDDATGKLKIWRIENLKKADVDPKSYGQFNAGDSFIVLYTYLVKGKENNLIYYWQGRDSSIDEKAASALLTTQLSDEIKKAGSTPVHVRVVQNKEPNHFLSLFKGRMIVHEGGVASGFKNRKDKDSFDVDGTSLFHIKGTNALNTRAVQVAEAASSLNSGDCFALLTPESVYVWQGHGASDTEKKTADTVASIIQGSRKLVHVAEGEEPEAFWGAIGGKGPYAASKDPVASLKEPRLFQCSTASGAFRVEEIFNFTQDDLINDDVMILDAFAEVFVWVGNDSTKEEKENSLKAALDFVANSTDGRDKDTPVFRVAAGSEPPTFTAHFRGWDDRKASDFEDPYLKKLGVASKPAVTRVPTAVERVSSHDIGFLNPATNKLTLSELKNNPKVDPSKKEEYLSDSEFHAVFKVTRAEFDKMAAWKKADLKKKANLF